MDLRRISPPLTQEQKLAVVSVEDVKAQARISHGFEDELIKSYIEVAYDFLSGPEGWLNRCCLLEEEFELYLPRLSGISIEIPLRPLAGGVLTSFERLGVDGVYTAVDEAVYYVTPGEVFPRISRPPGAVWPYASAPHPLTYRIRFKAGFGDAAAIPNPIKMGIKLLAATLYKNRESTVIESRVTQVDRETEYGLRALCGRYRLSPDHS